MRRASGRDGSFCSHGPLDATCTEDFSLEASSPPQVETEDVKGTGVEEQSPLDFVLWLLGNLFPLLERIIWVYFPVPLLCPTAEAKREFSCDPHQEISELLGVQPLRPQPHTSYSAPRSPSKPGLLSPVRRSPASALVEPCCTSLRLKRSGCRFASHTDGFRLSSFS